MKKKLNILIISLFLSCNAQKKEECLVNLENNLAPKLNKEIIQKEIINIKDSVNCFEWDSLLVESGYGNKTSIKEYYNIDIPYDYYNSNLDSQAIIFFLKKSIVVNHITVDRDCRKNEICKTFDFLTLVKYNKDGIIAKKDAVFEVFTKKIGDNKGNKWNQYNAIRVKTE
jgi:hypothetical protein